MAAVISWKANTKGAQLLCHLGALLAVGMWGASFVATKVLINNGLGPVEIYIYRFILAYLVIVAICHTRLFAKSWKDEGLLFLCGLCGSSIYFVAENTAVGLTRVSDVSMITTLSPLLTTMLIGALYKNERPNRWIYAGSVIAFLGVGFIVFKDGLDGLMPAGGEASGVLVGDLLALFAACSWAVYSVVLKNIGPHYSALFITRKTFFYGVVTALPYWLLSGEGAASAATWLQPQVLGNLLFLGLCCSGAAYLLWAAVMGKLGAITTNNYLYIQPVVTMLIAAVLPSLHDPLTIVGCLGAALIIGGLWFGDYMANITRRRWRR